MRQENGDLTWKETGKCAGMALLNCLPMLAVFAYLAFAPVSRPPAAIAQDPAPPPQPTAALKLPASVKGEPGQFVTIPAETTGKVVRWVALDGGLQLFPVELLKDTRTAVVIAQKAGKYRLLAYSAVGDVPTEPAVCVVVVGDPPPEPLPPPKPPEPGPDPPAPDGKPAAGTMAVLIVEETAERSKLPPAQLSIIFAKQIRDYLKAKTAADPTAPDGKAARIYDKDMDLAADAKLWRDLMGRERKSLPWLIIADTTGKVYHEGALPGTVDEALAVLKKYGE